MTFITQEAPTNPLTVNQWRIEINGQPMASFSKLGGILRESGMLEASDSVAGIKLKFSDQLINYGELTLTRLNDPADPLNNQMSLYVDECLANGTKFNGTLVKYDHGSEIYRIHFEGMLFYKEELPELDKVGAAFHEESYTAAIDYWKRIYS